AWGSWGWDGVRVLREGPVVCPGRGGGDGAWSGGPTGWRLGSVGWPRRVRRLVDDVAEIVEATGIRRLAGSKPRLARLPAFPGAGGEAQNLDLDAATLQRARENIG